MTRASDRIELRLVTARKLQGRAAVELADCGIVQMLWYNHTLLHNSACQEVVAYSCWGSKQLTLPCLQARDRSEQLDL
eukprot:scaffold600_cov189-Amphora_coffeaeformis.AAC.3